MLAKKRLSLLAIASTSLVMLAKSAIAHPLSSTVPLFEANSICGVQGVPYVARSLDQKVLGLRCVQQGDRAIEMGGIPQMTWYGANQGREGAVCYQGAAMAAAQSPMTWHGDAIAVNDPVPELLNLAPEPFVLQVTQGQWPFPQKIQLRGRQQEVWIRLQSPQRWQSWMNSLKTCDRHFRRFHFESDWGEYDWLTRPGSGWDWLWRNRR